MKPAGRRAAVRHLQQHFAVSERRACRLIGFQRSTLRYHHQKRDDGWLRARLRNLAAERPRFGYRRRHVLLRREGHHVNHKRIQRRDREEGVAVRRQRNRGATGRGVHPIVGARPNDRWWLAVVRDALASGRRLWVVAILDPGPREALASEVATSLPDVRVVHVLDRLIAERGRPQEIVLDHGPELTSRRLDQWVYQQPVRLQFIEPGKPIQNAFIERCNSRLRDECLNVHWFTSLADAQLLIDAWRLDDHQCRPQRARLSNTRGGLSEVDSTIRAIRSRRMLIKTGPTNGAGQGMLTPCG